MSTEFFPSFEHAWDFGAMPECKGSPIPGSHGLIGCFACDFTGTLEGYQMLEDAEKALANLPGFEQHPSASSREALTAEMPHDEHRGNFPVSNRKTPDATPQGRDFPISNRKTSDDLISTEATSVFKTALVKGIDSTDTLATPHRCGDVVFTADGAKGFGVSVPLAARCESRDVVSLFQTEQSATTLPSGRVFRGVAEKGLRSIPTLISNDGDFDSIEALAARGVSSIHTLDSTDGEFQTLPFPMSGTEFRAKQFLRTLSRQERVAVSRRRRFRNLPWIVPAGQDDSDQLP